MLRNAIDRMLGRKTVFVVLRDDRPQKWSPGEANQLKGLMSDPAFQKAMDLAEQEIACALMNTCSGSKFSEEPGFVKGASWALTYLLGMANMARRGNVTSKVAEPQDPDEVTWAEVTAPDVRTPPENDGDAANSYEEVMQSASGGVGVHLETEQEGIG